MRWGALREAADTRTGYRPFVGGWKLWQQQGVLGELLRPFFPAVHDTRVISAALIARFGSLPEVLVAPTTRLMEVEGVDHRLATYLHLILHASRSLAQERIVPNQPLLASWSALIDYLHITLSTDAVERLRILFLNKRHRLIADELHATGTIDHVPIYPREIIKRSLELAASSLILVHNHPSDDPTPSSADVRMTRELAEIGKKIGITLYDHIIVAKLGHVSMRSLRLL